LTKNLLTAVVVVKNKLKHNNRSEVVVSMKMDVQKVFASALVGASMLLGGQQAKAEIDYDGIKYLGGAEKIDLNNANIRAYLKVPGMYPTIAGKVVSAPAPFKSVGDVYNIPGLSGAEKDIIKKNEGRFVVLDPKPEYVIDKINNGLYR